MHLLERLADRYEADQCPHLAAGIREALAGGGMTLTWRSIIPRGFQTDAQVIPPETHPADFWRDIEKTDPDAYDRPTVWVGRQGPCHIHSSGFSHLLTESKEPV